MLISVIIPMYNGAKYILKCLDSIHCQDIPSMEVIIVDDGSTDNSVILIKEYIRTHTLDIILASQSNQGQGASRNRGMDEAHGNFLVFVDQDDTLEPNILPKMVEAAERQHADIVTCGYRRVTENGKIKQEVQLQQEEWSKYKIIAPWGKMYRMEFIKKNNIRFLPVVLGEDVYFLMQAYAHKARVVFMVEIAYNWLYNPASVSNTTHRRITDETALLNLYETLEHMPGAEQLKQDRLYEYFLIKTAIYDILITIGSNPYKMIKMNKNKIWEWFSCHFPSYQRNPYVNMNMPRGENWEIRSLVWIYMVLKRWNAEDVFLWCAHGISMMVRPDMAGKTHTRIQNRYKKGMVAMQDIIEKINSDYLEVYQSQRYKLGDMLFGILEGIKTFQFKKSCNNAKLLWEGIKIQKYTSKTVRYTVPKEGFIPPRTAVYMALFGNYDKIMEPVVVSGNCDYYLFTDQEINNHSVWKKMNLTKKQNDRLANMTGMEKNRFFKMLGYRYFSDYEYSVYVDSNMEIYYDLSNLDVYADTESGIAMYNHPARGCIYNEAKVCVISGKADRKAATIQMKRFHELGMPANYGMCECNVIVRKNASQKCRYLMEEWWAEFCKSRVKRDQIVFPYVLWKNRIDIHEIGCLGEDVDLDGKFRRKMHV